MSSKEQNDEVEEEEEEEEESEEENQDEEENGGDDDDEDEVDDVNQAEHKGPTIQELFTGEYVSLHSFSLFYYFKIITLFVLFVYSFCFDCINSLIVNF
jgi:hypothetical protein